MAQVIYGSEVSKDIRSELSEQIAALREGKTAVDERAWAWEARQEPNLSTPCEPS